MILEDILEIIEKIDNKVYRLEDKQFALLDNLNTRTHEGIKAADDKEYIEKVKELKEAWKAHPMYESFEIEQELKESLYTALREIEQRILLKLEGPVED